MKQILLISTLFLGVCYIAQGQEKVKKSALIGEWNMVITGLEEEKREYYEKDHSKDRSNEDASDRFESAIESAVHGFVSDLLGDMSFKFTFKENNTVRMDMHVMGVEEIEHVKWRINDYGALVIENDGDDHFSSDDVWMMDGKNRLVQVDEHGYIENEVYMERVR